MANEKFTKKEFDAEIMQIIQQQTGRMTGTSGPPNILKSMINREKSKRNGGNGTT